MFDKQSAKTILLWVVFILIILAVWQIMVNNSADKEEIAFSEFERSVAAGQIAETTITGMDIKGKFTEEGAKALDKEGQVNFKTVGVIDPDLRDLMRQNSIKYVFKSEDGNSLWQQVLIYWLPLILLLFIFFIFMRQIQGGSGKAMSFGKSKARLLNESQNKVTFEDVAGIQEAKEELQEIVEFLRDPKRFTKLGGRIPKGVLLMGPPGTGKTLLARAIAGEAGVPFYSISGSDFVEMFVGVGASRVRDLFEQGKKQAPCIIFIDEIDAVGRHRGAGLGGGHDEREQTLNQLLVEMDGFESNEGVILIAATNRPDVLDPALLRPGRFDRRVVVPRPDVGGREGILKVHTRKTPLGPDVDLNKIARGTPGFSGADLENLVNEAALMAARRGKDRLEMEDFEEAKDKVLMGAERKSAIISDKEKRVTAYHEAGHAIVAKLQPGADPVHKVTIIPRGMSLGLMQQLPSEDRLSMTRDYALKRLAIMMGGRVAEELIFNEITTGAGQDIKMATDMTRNMVCQWGMSEKLGPIAYGSRDESPFIGQKGISSREFSEQTAREIDEEIHKIVTTQHEVARQILYDNLDLLKLLAEALLEFEVLDSEEIDLLVTERDMAPLRAFKAEQEKRRSPERKPRTDFNTTIRDELANSDRSDEDSTDLSTGDIWTKPGHNES